MTHSEFTQRRSFNKEELVAFANGTLLDDGPREIVRLPAPPLLMLDRVVDVEHNGNRGRIVAEQDITLDAWYFWCHFRNDPVQPGCLGIEAIWQMLGFYIAVRGHKGGGRALGCGEIDFAGQIRPHNKLVRFELEVSRVTPFPEQGAVIGIADGKVLVDGEAIYTMRQARLGLFTGIAYSDYPNRSAQSVGGVKMREKVATKGELVEC